MNVILDIALQQQRTALRQRLQKRFGHTLNLRENWGKNVGYTLHELKPDFIIISHRRALEFHNVLRQYAPSLPIVILESSLLRTNLGEYTAVLYSHAQPYDVLRATFKLLLASGYADPRAPRPDVDAPPTESVLPATPTISGDLSVLSLVDLVQYLAQGGKTGCLEINGEWGKGELYFSEGNLIHTTLDYLKGLEALTRLIDVSDTGFYAYKIDSAASERSLHGTISELLLRAAVSRDHENDKKTMMAPADAATSEFFDITL